ncbi:MAG: hypothetical protein IKC59_05755 [Clostridia bacterium]|nr:hypothetical protein [Clostridia bacterium]
MQFIIIALLFRFVKPFFMIFFILLEILRKKATFLRLSKKKTENSTLCSQTASETPQKSAKSTKSQKIKIFFKNLLQFGNKCGKISEYMDENRAHPLRRRFQAYDA